nr:IclR family transcriptional regulator C-terminal domain-containing protein [Rhodococcus fascians]
MVVERLAEDLHEHVSYSTLTGPDSQEVIAESAGGRLFTAPQRYLGLRFPLHASANGKLLLAEMPDDQVRALLPEPLQQITPSTITTHDALLAELARARKNGYVVLDNELEEGLFAIGVPVRDRRGNLIGDLVVTGIDRRLRSVDPLHYVERLAAGAEEIRRLFST